jgi:hypothetical protein
MAVGYYDKNIFKGATYADLHKQDGPLILINATDLANGVRFSFVQEYFNLLEDEQVDRLIEAGGELLRNNPEFRRLLSDLDANR